MAKKRRAHDEEAWTNAKKICRLDVRQVEMARAIGMNPRKLPGLRPSPQERWKLPVGEFIEQRYWKRFGGHRHDEDSRGPEPRSRQPSTGVVAADLDADVSERVQDPVWQLSDLACYLVNLADDLQQWLAHGSIDPEVLPQVREELGRSRRLSTAALPVSRRRSTAASTRSRKRSKPASTRSI